VGQGVGRVGAVGEARVFSMPSPPAPPAPTPHLVPLWHTCRIAMGSPDPFPIRRPEGEGEAQVVTAAT
jgi:hypothetical protein